MKDSTELLAPRARSTGLVVRELDGEVLIYDLERDRALALNRTAGLVWRHCDGATAVGAMVQLVGEELGEPVAEDTIWQALAQLSADHLLEGQAILERSGRVMSRRSMMQKVGLAAAAASITSIVVPTVALATCPSSQTVCLGACGTGATCNTGVTNCTTCGGTLTGSCHICCVPAGSRPAGNKCDSANQRYCCSGTCGTGNNCG